MIKKLNRVPCKSHEVFAEAICIIGMTALNKLYSGLKSSKCPHCKEALTEDRSRTIYSWGADPDYCGFVRKNPVDRMRALISEFVKRDRKDIATALVDMFAADIDAALTFNNTTPDKKNIQDELLDDLPALAAYHNAIIDEQPVETIRSLHRKVIDELDQNMALIEAGRAGE